MCRLNANLPHEGSVRSTIRLSLRSWCRRSLGLILWENTSERTFSRVSKIDSSPFHGTANCGGAIYMSVELDQIVVAHLSRNMLRSLSHDIAFPRCDVGRYQSYGTT